MEPHQPATCDACGVEVVLSCHFCASILYIFVHTVYIQPPLAFTNARDTRQSTCYILILVSTLTVAFTNAREPRCINHQMPPTRTHTHALAHNLVVLALTFACTNACDTRYENARIDERDEEQREVRQTRNKKKVTDGYYACLLLSSC
jgi:hypothetical protein